MLLSWSDWVGGVRIVFQEPAILTDDIVRCGRGHFKWRVPRKEARDIQSTGSCPQDQKGLRTGEAGQLADGSLRKVMTAEG